MTTIRDIARLSGCSVSTVSRVLNNHPYVSEEKRSNIQRLIQELGYFPNRQARALSLEKSQHIAVMIPFTDHPYTDKMVSGILAAAFQQGYTVTLLPTNYDLAVEKRYLDDLAAKAWDGMIITSKKSSFAVIATYQQYAPIVCCEDTGTFPISCVSIPRRESLTDVFTQLKDQSFKQIGLTVGRHESESASTQTTLDVFRYVFGRQVEPVVIRNCRTYEDGCAAGKQLAEFADLDVIVANGDDVAAGILHQLPNKKVKIIGEENLLSSQLLHFSTIDHHLDTCGTAAFQLLFSETIQSLTIPYTFIERSSPFDKLKRSYKNDD